MSSETSQPRVKANSSKIGLMAGNDLRFLLRENVLRLALGIFVVMAIASSYISWSSQHILEVIYQEAIKMIPPGSPVPAFPVDATPALSILKNMIIYVVLIGSLLAIILGHAIGTRDRKAKTLRVLFSRPITRGDFFLAKVTALASSLGLITLFALLTTLVSLIILNKTFSSAWLGNLFLFYLVSYLFMLGFGLLSLGFGLREQRSAQALLIPIMLWIIVIFALPELGSALFPTGSLNPILPPTDVLQSPALQLIHKIVYPFSVSEQYKALSSSLIGINVPTDVGSITYTHWLESFLLVLWVVITFGLAYRFASKLEVSRDTYE
jgi:ABC-type transport system involved in multi-copper enzyme maturation permease subunit